MQNLDGVDYLAACQHIQFQIRTGPIFDFELNNRVTLTAGHYFTREQEDRRWTTIHRPAAGAETMMWNRAVEVDWRSLLERFGVPGEPDYFRFRNRFRLSPPAVPCPPASGTCSARPSTGATRCAASTQTSDVPPAPHARHPHSEHWPAQKDPSSTILGKVN